MLDKYRDMFVQEAHEHIQKLNESLLKLEREPTTKEYLHSIFRSAHTLKGMALTMGYDQTAQICAAIEDTLDKIRKGKERLSKQLIGALLKCFDVLEQLVDDNARKIDINQYLKKLQKPTTIKEADESESTTPIQLPTIRVKMKDLDQLVSLVGELVILKMRLEQSIPESLDSEAKQDLTTLGRITSELQDNTMRLRLVPIDQIFNRFPRMVRDLATNQGKDIKFVMEGLGIELDRTVLDVITDPLLHILRNAVDHGIETPQERESLGKSRSATIRLRSSREGDKIAIRVEDDGKGIDLEMIKSIAVEKKIISEKDAKLLTDDETFDLLGTPGLTTVKNVTDVSGRGVGFNVARKQINSIGGQIKIETKKSFGTSITLIIPLSLAIIGGLIVTVEKERYVVPISSIKITLVVDPSEILSVHGKEVVVYQNKTIPLIRLAETLGIDNKKNESAKENKITIIVIEKGNKVYGLLVDSFEHKQEIVVMRLDTSKVFQSSYPNATILSDGKVSLILDPEILV